MTGRRLHPMLLAACAALGLGLGIAGCGGASSAASDVSTTALEPPSTTTTIPPDGPACDDAEGAAFHAGESYAPDRALAPGQRPGGTVMQRILGRGNGGRLIVGVDENTPHFGVRGDDGQLQGLEIELVRAIARAIWPDAANIDDHIQWKTVVTDQKVPFVEDGTVDMTVSVVTMNCDRAKQVDFSTSYFTTPQKVMVRADSDVHTLADLDGRRVCVTAGSTTIDLIHDVARNAVDVPVEARTDCLVAFQEGRVDAIATHDTILFGFDKQEGAPTRILDAPLPKPSSYGIAMQKEAGEPFVRFVNGVLEQMRADGQLARLYQTFLTDEGYTTPPIPVAQYKAES